MHPAGVRRQAARLQADDVGDVDPGQRLAAAGQVAGAEDLEVVRGGVAGEARGSACPGGRSRGRRPSGCGRRRSRRWPGSRRRGPGGATASATVVSLSVRARGLAAKTARARSADGSVKSAPSPWERVSWRRSECSCGSVRAVSSASASAHLPIAARQRFSNSRSSWRKRGSWRIESRSRSSRM